MTNEREIYLRILNDLQFVSEVFDIIINEADSFGGKMLRERITIERNAIAMEQERVDRETIARQVEQEAIQEYKSE